MPHQQDPEEKRKNPIFPSTTSHCRRLAVSYTDTALSVSSLDDVKSRGLVMVTDVACLIFLEGEKHSAGFKLASRDSRYCSRSFAMP